MSWLSASGLVKRFEGSVMALDGAGIVMERGEFFTVVGPTNAGKSTLLKTIAGIERPDAGAIRLAGRDIGGLEPRDRKVSLLFQNIALFPTRTGFENIAFPLRTLGRPESEIAGRVGAIAALLKVAHLLDRLPQTFSGGEQQRVAIGRALAAPSDLLMLDEPLTNLDARLRIALRLEFKTLHRDTGQTILHVTHDQTEAMSLSDRIGVLNGGRFEQIGTPDDLYHRPATAFVAGFMGAPPMNLLPAQFEEIDGRTEALGAGFRVAIEGRPEGRRPSDGAIGIRPEAISVSADRTPLTPIGAEVLWVERLGSHHVLDLRLGPQIIKARVRADHPVSREGPAWLGFTPRSEHILDRRSGMFLAGAR
jgi:ABC-type sugar transport system ATPase subunit